MTRRLPVYPAEAPRVVTSADGAAWRREGYCCRCGDCCRGDATGGARTPDCPNLRVDDEGVASCADRAGAYYLAGCVDWPSKPEHVAPHAACTYVFTRVG